MLRETRAREYAHSISQDVAVVLACSRVRVFAYSRVRVFACSRVRVFAIFSECGNGSR